MSPGLRASVLPLFVAAALGPAVWRPPAGSCATASLRAEILNSVGERVRTYPTAAVAGRVTRFSLSFSASAACTAWTADPSAPFSPDGDCVNDLVVLTFPELPAGPEFSWDGSNDRGELASNGTYFAKVEVTSTITGLLTLSSPPFITLSARRPQVVARIHNAAGFEVAAFPAAAVDGVRGLRLSPDPFEPSADGSSLLTLELTGVDDATLATLTWNGRDSGGRVVPSGFYLVNLALAAPEGYELTLTARFTVLRGPLDILSSVAPVPNPVSSDSGLLWVRYRLAAPGVVASLRLHVYAVSGELLRTIDVTRQPAPSDPLDGNRDGFGAVAWDLTSRRMRRVAPGLYVLVLEAVSGDGLRQRVSFKAAVR